MYVITGATGNTGSLVAEKLLAEGQKVRVVGRDRNGWNDSRRKVQSHSSLTRLMRRL
jgi:uncharacterized protein YbjT (DUF2867 family)